MSKQLFDYFFRVRRFILFYIFIIFPKFCGTPSWALRHTHNFFFNVLLNYPAPPLIRKALRSPSIGTLLYQESNSDNELFLFFMIGNVNASLHFSIDRTNSREFNYRTPRNKSLSTCFWKALPLAVNRTLILLVREAKLNPWDLSQSRLCKPFYVLLT